MEKKIECTKDGGKAVITYAVRILVRSPGMVGRGFWLLSGACARRIIAIACRSMPTPTPQSQPSDAELILLYRKGDENALATVIQRHVGSLYRFLYRMVNDAHLAEDLTQETFIKVWKHLARFDVSKSFKTWIFSIAKNVAIDELRKKRPLIAQFDDEDGIDPVDLLPDIQPLASEMMQRKETAEIMNGVLAELPPAIRSVVLLHDTEDMTFQEIADTVGEPMNTVKSRYRRAIALLRVRLAEHLPK